MKRLKKDRKRRLLKELRSERVSLFGSGHWIDERRTDVEAR
jgi:hypothetical protein